MGADHQGGPADHRRSGHDGDGAGEVRVQLLRDPRLGAVGGLRCHDQGCRRARRARAGRAVRRIVHVADQLRLAGPGPGARHRGPAARADAVLHRADRQGGPPLGRLGDRADRRLLPVHAGTGIWRGGAGRARPDPRRGGRAELRRTAACVRTRRCRSAGRHLGGGVRDHPGGRRRPRPSPRRRRSRTTCTPAS